MVLPNAGYGVHGFRCGVGKADLGVSHGKPYPASSASAASPIAACPGVPDVHFFTICEDCFYYYI